MTPDRLCPSTAAVVQRKLGAIHAWGFDLAAACSGFIYGLIVATKLIESGAARRVLLCGADRMSSVVNPEDRATAVLFADGAGTVLIEPIPAGGSVEPASAASVAARRHYVVQDGPAVYEAAVMGMAAVTEEILQRNDLHLERRSRPGA